MIKVLHLYTPNDSMIIQYVNMVEKNMGNGDIEICSTDDFRHAVELCKKTRPCILHLHGCCNDDLLKAASEIIKQGVRLVITPHGQAESWVKEDYTYQQLATIRKLFCHAYVLIARSPMEAEELKKLNWNTRIETIANPIITHTMTTGQMSVSLCNIYRKIMDSNVLELMSQTTQQAFHTLLKAGITGDERWVEPLPANDIDWHQLLIYARQEGVFSIIESGMFSMSIHCPQEQESASYLPDDYQMPVFQTGKPIVSIVEYAYRQFRNGQLSLLTLAELDRALRYNDVEDNILMQQLESAKLNEFFSSLLLVMSEQTGLDEGFMPCSPQENKTTEQIRTTIKKHLQI